MAESKTDRAIRIISLAICLSADVAPIDEMDGSPNWWMFHADAKKLVDDLKMRGFFKE